MYKYTVIQYTITLVYSYTGMQLYNYTRIQVMPIVHLAADRIEVAADGEGQVAITVSMSTTPTTTTAHLPRNSSVLVRTFQFTDPSTGSLRSLFLTVRPSATENRTVLVFTRTVGGPTTCVQVHP